MIHETLFTLIALGLLVGAMAKSAQIGLHTWLPNAMEGWFRALLKFLYMRKHPKTIWSIRKLLLFGKIQIKGQFAENQTFSNDNGVGFLETKRETLNIIDSNSLDSTFKYWFIGFTEGDGTFIINKNGYLEFKVTQSSVDAQILYYIKKELRFGTVSVQDKINKTHHFRVRNKQGILKLISISMVIC